MRNYQNTLDWMYAQLPMYQRQGTSAFKKDLTNIKKLCAGLGNPERNIQFIHVAGTNGKGSVSHIIAGILQSQGMQVGMYTSPHYKDFRERIKINGELMSRSFVKSFINDHQQLIEDIEPSFFEITVAMALYYFKVMAPDIVVMEVGLGGRLDSTNIITPLLSVITNISFDHQSMLGNTLPEIAKEKAGIIKQNIPVVIGEHQKETDFVFQQTADNKQSQIYWAEDTVKLKVVEEELGTMTLDIINRELPTPFQLKTDLTGSYQLKNIGTALTALILWQKTTKQSIDWSQVSQSFPSLKQMTYFLGRWQILNTRPLTIADSAHNLAGIHLLRAQVIKMKIPNKHIVIGTVNDKDIDTILNILPKDAKYYFCKANIPRGLDSNVLKESALKHGLMGKSYSSVKKAYAAARKTAHPEDLIMITGSIFIVAEAI